MTFIEEVRNKRKKLADVLVDEEYSGLRELVEELYPDKAHFIYELLQNAEDTGASSVQFRLQPEKLTLAHDGRSFSEDDVWGITNIGKGTKRDDEDKIGRFGVGFKAVFAYSETPSIWSPTHNFQISDLVLPSEISARPNIGNATVFEFPFNNPKKSAEAAFKETADGLGLLSETLLVFLHHIRRVKWEVVGQSKGGLKRIDHSSNVIEVRKDVDGESVARSFFLRFSQPVKDLPRQKVAVAFPLERKSESGEKEVPKALSDVFKIVPAAPGRVSVYFPAEKEVSALRFHVHAPFVPELSRASIKDTPANDPLFEQLAELVSVSLEPIRDLGFLTVDFLNVLPHGSDGVPEKYACIRDSIVNAMRERALTPTQSKSHLPSIQLVQGKALLKELLPSEDLLQLFRDEDVQDWAVAAPQRHSNADRFLSSLNVRRWDTDHFAKLLQRRRGDSSYWDASKWQHVQSEQDDNFDHWYESKDSEWYQRLYAMLYKEFGENQDLSFLKSVRIIRLNDSSFGRPDRCFFPAGYGHHDPRFPQVDASVYTSGKNKNEQENARNFLEASGVREVGEKEQVQAILDSKYAPGVSRPSFDEHLSDLRRFLSLVRDDVQSAKLFENCKVLLNASGEWSTPNGLFLDLPFQSTGLTAFFGASESRLDKIPIAREYGMSDANTALVRDFADCLGVVSQLKIEPVSCFGNPYAEYLVYQAPGNPSRHKIDKDYQIIGLPDALMKPTVELAKLIWTMLARESKSGWTKAKYRTNQTQHIREKPSQLTVTLRDCKWLPQQDGRFVSPADADYRLFPDDFEYAPGWTWLADLCFGENIAKKTEEYRKKREFASELGFNDIDSLNDAKWFAQLDPDAREQLKNDYLSRSVVELPEQSPPNPERRTSKVRDLASEAPLDEKEIRQRSVSLVNAETKKEVRPYLRDQYTNADGVMICQICQAALPFQLPNGEPYFETVSFLPADGRLHFQNYLALCPNHAAMFKHVNESKEALRPSFETFDGARFPIVLGGKQLTIYVTDTHRTDIKAVLSISEDSLTEETPE